MISLVIFFLAQSIGMKVKVLSCPNIVTQQLSQTDVTAYIMRKKAYKQNKTRVYVEPKAFSVISRC